MYQLRIRFLSFLVSFLSLSQISHGQPSVSEEWYATLDIKKPTIFEYLSGHSSEELIIEIDFELLKEKLYEDEYMPARLFFEGKDKQEVWNIELKARGRFRRKTCDFPPLKIKFKKKDLDKVGLKEKYNKLKLVTHCKEEFDNQQLVLREYLVYKLYNKITDYSFRVRHFKVKWIDAQTEKEIAKQWAFFIESDEELAKRVDGDLYEYKLNEDYEFDEENRHLFPLFQYMIGNHDYSLVMAKNLQLIQKDSDQKIVAVPYDFDYSGVVNAPYKYSDPYLQLSDRRDRKFIGESLDTELEASISFLNEKENSLIQSIKEFKSLAKRHRTDIINYIEEYFESVSELKVDRPESKTD